MRRREIGLAAAVAAVVTAPIVASGLEKPRALVAQAAAVLAVVVAILVWGALRRPLAASIRLVRTRRAFLAGAASYAAAAFLGAIVGLLRGNELQLVAGQTLAMLLLPLGAAAGVAAGTPRLWRAVSLGALGGVTLRSLILVSAWARNEALGLPTYRLYTEHGISIVGHGLMGFVLLGALFPGAGRRGRAALVALGALILFCIAASGTRSLWLVTPLAAVLFAVALGIRSPVFTARRVRIGLGVAAAAALALFGAFRLLAALERTAGTEALPVTCIVPAGLAVQATHPSGLAPGTAPVLSWRPVETPPRFPLSGTIAAPREGRYRLMAWGQATPGCDAAIALEWLDAEGRVRGQLAIPLSAPPPGRTFQAAGDRPAGATRARLVAASRPAAGAEASAQFIDLTYLGPHPALTALVVQLDTLRYLAGTLTPALTLRRGAMDPSASYRLAETTALARLVAVASLPAKLLGHGLGARVPLNTYGFDNAGNRVLFASPNYIHNFYMFLLFKLGIAGTLL
ncbi:MAG TPA: hypothetical protein VLW17_02130, partial [Thermoanaerobaculaceae bacterium]|nr:hypothetical protein [Thermoanaerobaculaceae bacterium]